MTKFKNINIPIEIDKKNNKLELHTPPKPLDLNLVGRAGDVLFTPLYDDDVVSSIPDDVPALVVVLTLVFELDLVARSLGAVDTDVHDVRAWKEKRGK